MSRKVMQSDDDIEQEIERLKNSYYVKLAMKEERIRYRRRKYAYQLRMYEKRGKTLANSGVTFESLDALDLDSSENASDAN